jgi:hypothetical protein
MQIQEKRYLVYEFEKYRDPERPGKYLEGPGEDLETTLNAAGKIWNDREKGRKSYKKF